MKVGRLNAEDQRKHEIEIAKMAVLIRMRPDLSYPQIAKMFDCSESMVRKVVRIAGLSHTRAKGRKPRLAVVNV